MKLSSTIARSFSAELADIFRLDESVADLDAKIDERCVTPLPTPTKTSSTSCHLFLIPLPAAETVSLPDPENKGHKS